MSGKKIVFNPIGWLVGSLIGMLVVSYVLSLDMPLRVVSEAHGNRYAKAGEPFEICRNVEYTKDATITIDRALLRNLNNGDIININYPSFTINREKGTHNICRKILLPPYLEEGRWTVVTYITHNLWFWHHTTKIKDIPIIVED